MKTNKLAIASLAAVIGSFAAFANTAKADTTIRIGIGNFGPGRSDYNQPRYETPGHGPVVYGPSYGPSQYGPRGPVVVEQRPRGHWENVSVKTWVPGYWTTSCDRHGRTVRIFQQGYFAFRTERVWVSYRG